MRTIKLTIEYDGTNYAGWQVQPNGLAVQQVVEEALLRLLGERVRLRSSGRTDAGVHARAMVASFTTSRSLPLQAFVGGANRFLPDDIAILSAAEAAPEFRPIQDARAKWYRYTIYNAPVRSPLRRLFSWHVREPLARRGRCPGTPSSADRRGLSTQSRPAPSADARRRAPL